MRWKRWQMHINHTHHWFSITERSCHELHRALRPNDLIPLLPQNLFWGETAHRATVHRLALHNSMHLNLPRSFELYFTFFSFLYLFKCHFSPFFFSAFHLLFFFSASLCLITSLQQNIWKAWIPATRHALRCDSQWDQSGSHSVACTVPDKNSLWSTNSAVLLSCAQIQTQKQKPPRI